MKIALCTDSFVPVVDGVGRVVERYATELSSRGHECYVITPIQPTGWRGRLPYEIVDFMSIAVPTAKQYKAGIATLDPHYMERIKDIQFDLVHAHSPAASGIEAQRIALRQKIPLIGTFHSKYYDDLRRYTHSEAVSLLGVKFVVNFFERCDETWTVSNHAAETLRSYGYRGEIKVVHNGNVPLEPDPAYEKAAREQYGLDDRPILLYAGQIDRKKNIFIIPEVACLLAERGRDFRLIFAGQGADADELRKVIGEKGLSDRTVFTGHIYDSDLLNGLYMAASLFIFPSEYDTAGLVVSEAAMMGTPSIVIEGSAPAEWVTDRKNGIVCDGSIEDMAARAEDYLFNYTEDMRAGMSDAARRTIPEPWDRVINGVEENYARLTGAASAKE